jgi:hypothetical protein
MHALKSLANMTLGELLEAFEGNPNSPDINYAIGRKLMALEKYKVAIEYFQTSIALKPRFPEAYLALSELFDKAGDAAASAHFRSAAEKLFQEAETRSEARTQAPAAEPEPELEEDSNRVWYYRFAGEEFGPFSLDEMREIARTGDIHRQTRVWRTGQSRWLTAEEVPELDAITGAAMRSLVPGYLEPGTRSSYAPAPPKEPATPEPAPEIPQPVEMPPAPEPEPVSVPLPPLPPPVPPRPIPEPVSPEPQPVSEEPQAVEQEQDPVPPSAAQTPAAHEPEDIAPTPEPVAEIPAQVEFEPAPLPEPPPAIEPQDPAPQQVAETEPPAPGEQPGYEPAEDIPDITFEDLLPKPRKRRQPKPPREPKPRKEPKPPRERKPRVRPEKPPKPKREPRPKPEPKPAQPRERPGLARRILNAAFMMAAIAAVALAVLQARDWYAERTQTPPPPPQKAALAYINALHSGDQKAIKASLSRDSMEAAPDKGAYAAVDFVARAAADPDMRFTIIDVKQQGGQAIVRGALKSPDTPEITIEFLFFLENNAWKIHEINERIEGALSF